MRTNPELMRANPELMRTICELMNVTPPSLSLSLSLAHPLRRPLLQMIRADDELLYNVALSRSKQASRGEQRRAEASET